MEKVWQRLGMDITHCGGRHCLTFVDCGPSSFAVWRQLRLQTSESTIKQLEAVFYERGAPEEILTDNDTADSLLILQRGGLSVSAFAVIMCHLVVA